MLQLPDALAAMKEYKQFIIYKIVPGTPKDKKLPVDHRTLQVFKEGDNWQQDPAAWTGADEAIAIANMCGDGYGVGFFFTKNDPFFFLDIDYCLINGDWSPVAKELCNQFTGAAIEISHSGGGLHIFGSGAVPEHGCKYTPMDLELYTEKRFAALTGDSIKGDVSKDCSGITAQLVDKYFPPKVTTRDASWTTEPLPEYTPFKDDEALLKAALASSSIKSKFGQSATFRDLWERNADVLAEFYAPDASDTGLFDESDVDAALAQHLAFYTGCNCDHVADLMWRSGLVRDKWTVHKKYLAMTVTRAVSLQTVVYTAGDIDSDLPTLAKENGGKKLSGSPAQKKYAETIRQQKLTECGDDGATVSALCVSHGPAIESGFWIDNKDLSPAELAERVAPVVLDTDDTTESLTLREGYQFLPVDQQLTRFKGCIYITDSHRVLTPKGMLLKPDQFNAVYGGYVFQLDGEASGKTTKKAWDVFVESQVVNFPKADKTCFRPDLAQGATYSKDGWDFVNNYVPVEPRRAQGDASPFLLHLSKVLPDQRDQAILLSYMAACIQHKGTKFQWAPLIQGVEGNGKTLFSRCVEYAIGERYSHMPRSEQITEKFNTWLFNTMFIGVEDIYVPDHKLEIIEILKPMVTGTRFEKRGMQTDQAMQDICCNFIFNSNHKDAVRKTRNDRRFCIFYTAQQAPDDMESAGMNGSYFPDLYEWLRADGYAIVANYLDTYQIPAELNPAGACHRAPVTTSTDEAVTASMGGIEQEVIEAIAEGKIGFAGGWVSSKALERLLQSIHATRKIPHNKRRDLLQSLGYEWHPALPNGRVNNYIALDEGKPKLFVKNGSVNLNITDAAEVAKAYQKAQGSAAALSIENKFANS